MHDGAAERGVGLGREGVKSGQAQDALLPAPARDALDRGRYLLRRARDCQREVLCGHAPPGGAGEKAAQAQSGSWPAACCQAPVP